MSALDVLPNAEELDARRKLISKKSGIQSLHARGDSQLTRERTRRPAAEPDLSVEAYAVELSRVLEAKALVKNR